MPRVFDHPIWLTGTAEGQAAEVQRQELALASHSRARLSEAERLIGRGQLLETTARQNLSDAKGRDKDARILAQSQLADALGMQGRYTDAAKLHPDKHRRKYFRDLVRAIEKPDAEKCRCKDKHIEIDKQPVELTPRLERARIFSPVHGEIVSVVECLKCGHKNARPLRSRLLKHRAAMEHNVVVNARLLNDQVINASS